MNTLKIQSLKALRAELTAVARGEEKAPADASQTSFESVEAMARLLTRENRALLAVIDEHRPQSVAALAAIVQRAEPNVSRTLSKLVDAGFVTLHEGKGNAKVPEVKIHRVTIEIDTLHWTDHIMTA
jgi:predicted transcriptional regulator